MIVDALRSHYIAPARGLAVGEGPAWIRWYPTSPTAKPLGIWTAFTPSVWEDDDEPDFEGPGELPTDHYWRPKAYPARPGTHYHGKPEWFLEGIPPSAVAVPPVPEICGEPVIDARGGITLSGLGIVRPEDIDVSLTIQKTTLETQPGGARVLTIGDGTAYRLTAAAPLDIQGITDGVNGRMIILENVGTQPIRLMHFDLSAPAAARIIAIDQHSCRLHPGMATWLQYDGTSLRWREINTAPFVREKGDLLTHTLTTPARLPISEAEGHVLTTDPGSETGLKWAPGKGARDWWYYPPGRVDGVPYFRWVMAGYVTGQLYFSSPVTPNMVYALPLPRPRGGTLAQVSLYVGSQTPPDLYATVGVYSCTPPPNFQPDVLMAPPMTANISGTGIKTFTPGAPISIPPDSLIWLALLTNYSVSVMGISGQVSDAHVYPMLGFRDAGAGQPGYGYRCGSSAQGDAWPYSLGLPTTWPPLSTGSPSVQVLEWGSSWGLPGLFCRFTS